MSWVAAAVVGGAIIGGTLSSSAQKSAANTAASAQERAAQLSVDEQRRQFDEMRKLLDPYVNAGTGALSGYQNLLGLGGQEAQKSAINAIQGSPEFSALQQQGEQGILANASATGGLRGGNTQAALAQFRPALLSQLINEQYGRLGGLASMGQNAAAGVGNAGIQTGQGISSALNQAGAAQAGNALAEGKANAQMYNTIGQSIGMLGGRYFGGQTTGPSSGIPSNYVF